MYLPSIKSAAQVTKDRTFLAMKPWWIVLIGAAILYIAPARSLLETPVMGSAISTVAIFIPSTLRWMELSPFPQNTKIFVSFVWLMIPVHVYWLIRSNSLKKYFQINSTVRISMGLSWMRLTVLLAFLLFLGAFLLVPWNFAIVDSPLCRICVNTVRWAQLSIGCIFSLVAAWLITFFLVILPLSFKSSNSGENKNV